MNSSYSIKPFHIYKVLSPFGIPHLKKSQVIKVLTVGWSTDPEEISPNSKNIFVISYIGGATRLYENADHIVLENLSDYVEEIGTFSQEDATREKKEWFKNVNQEAKELAELELAISKIDINERLKAEHEKNPRLSTRELLKKIKHDSRVNPYGMVATKPTKKGRDPKKK